MADDKKKPSKEARKFVSLLASRFKEDEQDIDSEELRSYFTEAVSSLPKSKVKAALQKEFEVHFKHMSSFLNVLPKTPKQDKNNTQKAFKSNIYSKGGLEKILEALRESRSKEEKDTVYKRLQACYPYLTNTKKIFATLREVEESDDLSSIQKCTEITVGCHAKKGILECLSFILEEFSSKCEACINGPESGGKTKRLKELQDALHRSIVLINHRWLASRNEMSDDVTTEETYEDLMAAMLSLYTDMQLVSSSIMEGSSTEDLATLIFAVLGHSPEHCIDVFLQVTQLDSNSATALIPLVRCVLERNQGILLATEYIKFISLARIGLHLCSLASSTSSSATKTKISIRKIAEKRAAPERFASLVSRHNKKLAESLGLSKKMTASEVTSRLLGEQREEDMEALLDLATETREESEQNAAEDHGPTDEAQGDQQTDQPLFFFDSSGGKEDEDETQRVEFEEHEVQDAILHRQLKTIIGQLQQQSDSEEEEADFDPEDLFIIDTKPSENSSQHENDAKDSDNDDDPTLLETSVEDQKTLDSASSPLKRKNTTETTDEKQGATSEGTNEEGREIEPEEQNPTYSVSRKKGKETKEVVKKKKRKSMVEATPVKMATRSSSRKAAKSYSTKK